MRKTLLIYLILLTLGLQAWGQSSPVPVGNYVTESDNQPFEFGEDDKVSIGKPDSPNFVVGQIAYSLTRKLGASGQDVYVLVLSSSRPIRFCQVIFTPLGDGKVAMGMIPGNPATCPASDILNPVATVPST